MATIAQIVAQIRTAIYGKDVRENIAQGIEKCYEDSTANAQIQEIINKGQETLDSIPEDYTALTHEVDDLKSATNKFVYGMGAAIKGKYINSSGTIQNNSSFAYIVIPYTTGNIEISGATNNSGIVKYWNSDMSAMTGGDTTWSNLNRFVKEEDIPEGTFFITVSFYISTIDTLFVFVEKGSQINQNTSDIAKNREDLTAFENEIHSILYMTTKDAIQGKYINTSGVISNNNSMAYLFVPYSKGNILISGATSNSGTISYWNADKTTMYSCAWSEINLNLYEEQIPSGTAFIGLSFQKVDVNNIKIWFLEIADIGVLKNSTDNLLKQYLFTLESAIKGYYINSQGIIQSNNNCSYIYMPYESGSFEIAGASREGIVKYWDSTKETILGGDTTWAVLNRFVPANSIPSGVKYISISFYTVDISNIVVFRNQGAEISALKYNSFDILSEVKRQLLQARKTQYNTEPLTLLHFSDIHADTAAMGRIIGQSAKIGQTLIDDIICTGDFVPNSAEQITSWWDENVMLVIGNHDTASYSDGVYDWTALSMADRIAYYITPFESHWGITRPTGKSYYYKDYASKNVRLIALDYMTYWADPSSTESTEQTSWLASILSDAITNSLHVIIAVHGPIYDIAEGNLSLINCQFSRADGDLIQSGVLGFSAIVSTVQTSINNGLKFVGYICGHTHSDNIYKTPEGQLIYCITCGIVNQPSQWLGSDMYRDDTMDAYNLVTVETGRTLVKIVRGGGANMDDHSRPRETLCIDYSTGTVMGETK